MDNTLFVLEGEAWRRVRNIVTPTLTSAKLRRMLPLLDECSDLLVKNLAEIVNKGQPISCQKVFSAFTLDAIGRCAFGMTINSLASEDDPFVAKANMLLQCFMSWRTYLTLIFPRLMKLLRMKLLNPETTEFYKNIILQVVEERKKVHAVREDFLQLLLDAENESTDSNNNNTKSQYTNVNCSKENTSGKMEIKPVTKGLSHDECLSQCISFFIAGYDATTSLLSYVLYNMAMHQDYQDTVVKEIESALEKHDGVLNYDTLSDLKFMDAVISECMRLCPTMVRSDRRAESDYVLGDTNIVLRKGMLVSIPIYAIHRDPEWYPEPDVFKPERFYNPDPNRPQYVHLPFGAGPRICVGMRFVQMQVKLCLAKVLQRFQVHPAPTTPECLEYTETRNVLKVNHVEVSLSERAV
ncbi:Cytochrome P450 3A1, partial [Stegodyphus mimosarum]